jgi:formate hydrogenlyase subunit 3/multisubunit Na+/H+ antiporter MnhD subunit
MSAPVIWIIIPFAAAVILWFTQQKRHLTSIISIGLCSVLGLIAIFQDIGSVLRLGPLTISVQSTLTILGRSFILGNSDRLFVAFVYLSMAFWFLGAQTAATSTKFIPLGMAVVSLLTAGLAVEPFLYSAILIELAVIISLPLLMNHGTPVGKGILRFLIFQSLAMPLILLAGWILSGVQTNFTDLNQLYIAAFFLGLGFAFLLGIFPFHFWIPQFCSENDPYINGFLLSILPIAYILIMLDFINGLAWLKDAAFLIPILRISGAIMVVTGGVWAAMQTDLRRIFGFMIVLETGFALISVSLRNDLGNQLLTYMVITRTLEIALWSLALKLFQKNGVEPDFIHLKGRFKEFPVASTALLVSAFSSAGLPLLASFPTRVVLLSQLSTQPILLAWILLGMAAMFFIASNILRILVQGTIGKWGNSETTPQVLFFVVGAFFLFLFGIFPSTFLESVWNKLVAILAL